MIEISICDILCAHSFHELSDNFSGLGTTENLLNNANMSGALTKFNQAQYCYAKALLE